MSSKIDSFEAFRRARQEEGFKPPPPTDRRAVAHRISSIIDNVTGSRCSDEAEETPRPEAPSRRELQNVLARLVAAADSCDDPALREGCVEFLCRFLERARVLLDGSDLAAGGVGEEYEIDHGDLLDFMRAPDLGRLRQAKGLPTEG